MKKHRTAASSLYKGLPLIDADKDLEIEVLKSDVTKSRRNDPGNCAAAIASKRMLKTDVEVHISRTYVKSPDGKAWIRFLTPEAIGREITSFDRSSVFEPGEYVLKAPGRSCRLDAPYPKRRGIDTGTGRKKIKRHITVNIRESARALVVGKR